MLRRKKFKKFKHRSVKTSIRKGFSKKVAQRNAQTLAESGCQQCQAGNYTAALAFCKRAIEIDANNYIAWFSQGCVLNRLERYEDAIASYDQAIKIKPDFDSARNKKVQKSTIFLLPLTNNSKMKS